MYPHIRHIKIPSPYAWWNYVDECGLMQAYWSAWRLLWPGAATWGGGPRARAHKTGKSSPQFLMHCQQIFHYNFIKKRRRRSRQHIFQLLSISVPSLSFFSQIFSSIFFDSAQERFFGNFVQHGLVGRLKEKGFSVTDHGDITLERVGGMNIHTVKKDYQYSRPQPGCHLPNSPWPGIIKLFPARENLLQCSPSCSRESLTKIKNWKTAFLAALLICYLIIFFSRECIVCRGCCSKSKCF